MSNGRKWYSLRFRVIAIGVVLILWALGCAGYRASFFTRQYPMGTGPAGPKIDNKILEKTQITDPVAFIGLGDSITRGFGTSKKLNYFELLQHNDDKVYPDMAGIDIAHIFASFEAKNYAVDYTVSQEHLDRQLPRIPQYPKDVTGIIVLTTGGNDLIHDYGRTPPRDGAMYGCSYRQAVIWTENVKQRIRKLLKGLTAKFPGGCEIFLANIYDPTDGVSDPESIGFPRWPEATKVVGLMNLKIAELCKEFDNVHLVDIHSTFLGHGIHCSEPWRKYYHKDDATFWYYQNLEDPNTRGYDAIRRLFLLEMVKVFSKEQEKVVLSR